VLELLAELCYEMQDLPGEGKYWILTAASGERVDEAMNAFHERYPTPASRLLASPQGECRAVPERWPNSFPHPGWGFKPHTTREPAVEGTGKVRTEV
jgi:hypothetical protein